MADLCGEPHPDIDDVFCDKETPCYYFHASVLLGGLAWGNGPEPPKKVIKGGKARLDGMANDSEPEELRGPFDLGALTKNRVKLRQTPHDTERGAAIATLPRSGTQRRRVYDALVAAGEHGMTDEEIQILLHMNPSTERPRRGELVEDGFVAETTLRRRVASGEQAIVWQIRVPSGS